MRKENQEQWITSLTMHVIGSKCMDKLFNIGRSIYPQKVRDLFGKSRILPAVKRFSSSKLGRICVMGTGNRPNKKLKRLHRRSNFGDLAFEINPCMMGDEMLHEIATMVICCIACDIVKETLSKSRHEKLIRDIERVDPMDTLETST